MSTLHNGLYNQFGLYVFLFSLFFYLPYIDYSLCQIWSVYMQYMRRCDHSNNCLFLIIQQAEVLLNIFGECIYIYIYIYTYIYIFRAITAAVCTHLLRLFLTTLNKTVKRCYLRFIQRLMLCRILLWFVFCRFTYIHKDHLTGIGAIIGLSRCS